MEAKTFEHVSAMPAPTWGFLRMNDATIEIAEGLEPARDVEIEIGNQPLGDAGAFEDAMQAAQASWDEAHKDFVVLRNWEEEDTAEKFGGLALSNYQVAADEMELARSLEGAFEMGVGGETTEFLQEMAGGIAAIATHANERTEATVRIDAVDAHVNAAALDLVAAPNSELEVVIAVDSPAAGSGVTGTSIRVFAGEGARVTVRRVQTLDDTWTDIDDMGLFLENGAVVEIFQTVLGAGKTYTGLAGDLRGEGARADVVTHYLGHGEQELDFNYTLRHHGKATECNIDTTGVLAGTSSKTLRATIDLIRGCKGAVGQETETVLIADEGATNKTVPTILCNEDDVMGNHGATIGHIRAEQLFYLASRGLSQEQAENMFISAALEDAYIQATDDAVKASVLRLGSTLVDKFEEVCA